MTIAIALLTVLFATLTLLPLWRHPHWLVRGLDFPRLQLAVAGALLLLAQVFLLPMGALKLGAIAVTLPCLIWLLWWLLPYTRLWPVEVKQAEDDAEGGADGADDGSRISILTANVLQSNRKADALIALVRQHRPDVLVALETNAWWEEQLDPLQDEMPFAVKCPQDNLYGMHVYSRLPITAHKVDFIVEDDVPSIHGQITLRNGAAVCFHFLHPAPPGPTENQESAERDAELVVVARSIAKGDRLPTIVTGDLNDVAWSTTTRLFRKISGLLDPRIGRGMFNTFHADYPLMRWPLDHLFHSDDFTLRSITRLPPIGSDHLPLLTRLTYAPGRSAEQEGPVTDRDDRAQADDIADAKGADHTDVPNPGASKTGPSTNRS
ncbi:endonuclease/exonuclease/phosphatase family protein [Hwanghaeella grinnelliae]|uniref:Endonuclease/exonuclease/phosphatase family protein n=1 Tax=Hwanghaeella grinnelliae TaxID=2500179 RepID=A0A3S2W337_9PROT|nr:endonuclease/exonuclease/phosphatase family protein [Hwanghaeella grinnelliae]RVU34883.1 endonuclease/exonuclease/phosphatase family protein [Hwanghaeella grinnelliae]